MPGTSRVSWLEKNHRKNNPKSLYSNSLSTPNENLSIFPRREKTLKWSWKTWDRNTPTPTMASSQNRAAPPPYTCWMGRCTHRATSAKLAGTRRISPSRASQTTRAWRRCAHRSVKLSILRFPARVAKASIHRQARIVTGNRKMLFACRQN